MGHRSVSTDLRGYLLCWLGGLSRFHSRFITSCPLTGSPLRNRDRHDAERNADWRLQTLTEILGPLTPASEEQTMPVDALIGVHHNGLEAACLGRPLFCSGPEEHDGGPDVPFVSVGRLSELGLT